MAINSADELARYGYLTGAGFGESIKNSILGPQGYYPIVQKARDAYLNAQMEADRIGLESERVSMLRDEYSVRKTEQAEAEEMNKLSAQAALELGLPAQARPLVEKALQTGQDWTKYSNTISMFGDVVAKKNEEMAESGQPGPYEPGEPFATSPVKDKIATQRARKEANTPYVEEYKRLTGKDPTAEQMKNADLAVINQNLTTQRKNKGAEELTEEERDTYTALAEKKNKPVPIGVNPEIWYASVLEQEKAAKEGKTLYVNLKNPKERKALTTEEAADPASLLDANWVTQPEWEARTRPSKETAGAGDAEANLKISDHKEKLRASLRSSHGAINAILAGRPVTDFGGLPPAVMAYMPQPGKEMTPEQKDMAVRQIRMLQAQTARELRNAPKTDPNENNNYPVGPFGDLYHTNANGAVVAAPDPLQSDPDVPLRYGVAENGQFTATLSSPYGTHMVFGNTVEELKDEIARFVDRFQLRDQYKATLVNPTTGRFHNISKNVKPVASWSDK
jgi:hypothetical protein